MLLFRGEEMIFNFSPSNAYTRVQSRIPKELSDYELILIHYVTDEFKCDRWTTRSRDIVKKHAKMLQFDMCHAYILSPERFLEFMHNVQKFQDSKTSFMFLGYRLSGDKWISTVDQFNFHNVCSIEHYGWRGESAWII